MAKKEAKYLTILRQEMENMSILQMIDRVLELSSPDDYDGCFTRRGMAEFDLSIDLLKAHATYLEEKAFR